MVCECKNCRKGLASIYCVATRTLSEAESLRLGELLDRRAAPLASPRTDQPKETT